MLWAVVFFDEIAPQWQYKKKAICVLVLKIDQGGVQSELTVTQGKWSNNTARGIGVWDRFDVARKAEKK